MENDLFREGRQSVLTVKGIQRGKTTRTKLQSLVVMQLTLVPQPLPLFSMLNSQLLNWVTVTIQDKNGSINLKSRNMVFTH